MFAGSGTGSRRRKMGMPHRGRRILSANVPLRLLSVAASVSHQRTAYIKVLDRHGLATGEA